MFLLLVIFFWRYTQKSFDRHLESFIELHQDIIVITSQTEILAMNRAGLAFFGFENLNALLKKTHYLSKLFSEVVSEDNRLIEGINWVTKIPEGKNIKVQISSGTLTQTFHMQVNPIKTDRYMVTFHNISRVIAEKNNISKLAQRDELTQIYNRAKIKSLLSLALRDAEIHHIPFSIIMVDIDHFKRINDSYGHDTGDKVLIEVTSLLRSLLRSHDEIGRWGGEEFIILSGSTTADEAYIIAERLRAAIETFSFHTSDRVTCSFGISEYLPGDTLTDMIKRSDEALYRAKKAGRNTVCR
jgi:diguanylate cyclase (GGDEF)-like protein